jgi:hypothetical protein
MVVRVFSVATVADTRTSGWVSSECTIAAPSERVSLFLQAFTRRFVRW